MSIIDLSKEYQRQTESKSIIRFQDCDPLRHLNNAKYFDYFFNAREDQVPKLYGVEIRDLIDRFKAVWVVYNHNIAYLRPANLGEWVQIITRVIWHNEDTIVVEYVMTDEVKSHLKTVLWSTLKYVGLTSSKTTHHSQEMLDYLNAIQYQGVNYDPKLFKERVKEIKEELKSGI